MERTISGMMGKGAINHNTRAFNAKNVDPERSIYNVQFCNEPMIWADRKGWDCWNDRYGEESYGAVMCQNSDGNRSLRYR